MELTEDVNLHERIRTLIQNDKYLEVFRLCKFVSIYHDEYKQLRQSMDTTSEVDFILNFMRYIYTDFTKFFEQVQELLSESELIRVRELKASVEYLTNCVKYIELINSSIPHISELLDSQFVTDFQVAMEFLVIASKFNVADASRNLLDTLKYMERIEQDRKDAVMNAFKEIYLKSDAKNIEDHKEIVIKQLIHLHQSTSYNNYDYLAQLISSWAEKGTLDNNIIDKLWQVFTKTTGESSRSALELLKMASIKRISIINKNIKLTSTIAFKERNNDVLLVKSACETLSIIGNEKQLISDENPPFRIKMDDDMWKDLSQILTGNFFISKENFLGEITSAVQCIYSVSFCALLILTVVIIFLLFSFVQSLIICVMR